MDKVDFGLLITITLFAGLIFYQTKIILDSNAGKDFVQQTKSMLYCESSRTNFDYNCFNSTGQYFYSLRNGIIYEIQPVVYNKQVG